MTEAAEGPRTPSATRSGPSATRSGLGWIAAAASLAYMALCHHGLGEPYGGGAHEWWQPRGFMHAWTWLGEISDLEWPGVDVAVLMLPALLLCAFAFLGTRSSIARAVALSSVAGSGLFAYYGLYAPGPWEFFHWRGSLVIAAIGFTWGFSAAAPLLARSWLDRGLALRLTLYLPVLLGTLALMRHATGWSAHLRFNISPWPAIPVFGLDIGAYLICGTFLALALAVATARSAGPAVLGSAGGAVLLLAWVAVRYGVDGARALPILAVFGAGAAIAIATSRRELRPTGALHLAVGAALIALPVLGGRALASGDYAHTRFARAQEIVDALGRFYEREEMYPDALDELVGARELARVPRPRIGFEWVYALGLMPPIEFEYQSHGSSYVLEFVSTEWVQCAYNPPWDPEDLEDLDPEDADLALGAWSCPDERPELW